MGHRGGTVGGQVAAEECLTGTRPERRALSGSAPPASRAPALERRRPDASPAGLTARGQARGQADRRAARPQQLSRGREANQGRRLTQAPSCGDDHRVRFPWQPQGYTRTCVRCGSIWQVPGSARRWWRSRLAYGPMARIVMIAGLSVSGDPAKVDGMVESISARKRLAESFRHCPECGADHFTQRASPGELPY